VRQVSFDELDAWVRGRAVIGKDETQRLLATRLALHPDDLDEPWDVVTLAARLSVSLSAVSVTLDDLLEVRPRHCPDLS
jgi:hypothetical protein